MMISEKIQQDDIWQHLAKEKRPIVIYGMGNGADKLINRLESHGIPYADFFASDGFVRGQTFHGKTVLSFSQIKEKYPDFVILLSFATSRREVLDTIYGMSEKYCLFMPDLPVCGDDTFDKDFYIKHQNLIEKAGKIWADDLSVALYHSILHYKLSADISYLRSCFQPRKDIYGLLPCDAVSHVVDAGAYRGDTLSEMTSFFPNIKRAIAIEPDRKSCLKLKEFTAKLPFGTKTVEAALGRACGTSVFHQSGNRNSSLVGSSYEHHDFTVPVVTVDSLCEGTAVDYIKYDVEGAETDALLGSDQTIKRERPILSVSVYHRSEDIFTLPLLLREICPNYRFFLRRTECLPAWEVSVLAIPTEKS